MRRVAEDSEQHIASDYMMLASCVHGLLTNLIWDLLCCHIANISSQFLSLPPSVHFYMSGQIIYNTPISYFDLADWIHHYFYTMLVMTF